MGGLARLFIGGLPISNELQAKDLMPLVGKYSKDIEIIRDSEGYCKGFAYVNVPHNVTHSCISDLAGKPFQKGLLRVEQAQEPFIDKLRREWGEAALKVQYTFPTTSSFTTSISNSSVPASSMVLNLDTSSKASAASKITPPAKTVFAKPTPTTPKPAAVTKLDEPATPATPLSLNKSKKEAKKLAYKEKSRLKELEKKRKADDDDAPVPAEMAPQQSEPEAEEVAEEQEEPTPTPAPKPAPAKKAPQQQQKKMALSLGDDDDNTTTDNTPTQPPAPAAKTPANKKAKTENNNNNNNKNAKAPETPKANNNNNNKPKAAPVTPAPAPAAPVTPATPASGTAGWDAPAVVSWAAGVAGDEIAEKLQAKGVRGRKLVNWRDSFTGDSNGLRKQISEFLQLPENLEADADDLSNAILRLA